MAGFAPDTWAAVSPLLDELFDADPAQCARRLGEIGRTDPALAERLSVLLAERDAVQREAFLEGRAVETAELAALAQPATLAGTRLGAYTIDRPLGEGGMGTVWLARRSDGRYEGEVAIKFLNLSLLGGGGAERFRREGNFLARLAHPGIARLLDAGVAATGQPYLVLEYVDGQPIDRWCEARGLDLRARLRLFIDVLAAVAHAHGKLVLHRDLKPANILVTAGGHVKLLDFGISKLLEDDDTRLEATALTRAGRAFTPDYAAPEQVLGGELTTAADVYSLGVVLYELLTGARPYKLRRASVAALEEAIAQQDIGPASGAARTDDMRRQLRGDLDAILNLALKKEPEARYATVQQLMADIERYLAGLPVQARPDSAGYRALKFVRRHRVAAGATLAVMAAVLAGGGAALWQAGEATRQRDRAFALSARNEAVVDFVNEMLTEVAPTDRPVQVSDLLERSVAMLTSAGNHPEHQAAILGMLANYFVATGNPGRGAALLDRALELAQGTRDTALRGTLLCERADAALLLGRPEEATHGIERGTLVARGNALAEARCLQKRATIAQNSNDSAGALRYALQAQARLGDYPVPKPELEATLLADIAAAHYLIGNAAEADRHFAASLAKYAEAGRAETPATISIRNNWAVASEAAGDYRRAFQLYDDALRIATQRAAGGEVPTYLLANRAQMLATLGRYEEALAADALAIESATRSGHALARIKSRTNRAAAFLELGDPDRAERELADAVAEAGTAVRPGSAQAMSIIYWRARMDIVRGRVHEAAAGLNATVAYYEERRMRTASLARALRTRADLNLSMGDADAALVDARRALEFARALQGGRAHSGLTGLALATVARVHLAGGRRAEAQASANEALGHLVDSLGDGHPETRAVRAML